MLELILALRNQGWLWTEEFIWHKKNCYPGKWPNRFRDAWERLLQFNKTRNFNMYQEMVRVPVGDWASGRLKHLSETDKIRDNSKSGSGFGKNISNWLNRNMVYPTNVVQFATVCNNKNHSAAFPEELPEWFINLFTKKYDWVLFFLDRNLFFRKQFFRPRFPASTPLLFPWHPWPKREKFHFRIPLKLPCANPIFAKSF